MTSGMYDDLYKGIVLLCVVCLAIGAGLFWLASWVYAHIHVAVRWL